MSSQGEGSRGGKIVGHTKSGRPIYQTALIGAVGAAAIVGTGIAIVAGKKIINGSNIRAARAVEAIKKFDFKTETFQGFSQTGVDRLHQVTVTQKGSFERIAGFQFSNLGDSKTIFPLNSTVDAGFQRSGIATHAYDLAEKLSGKLTGPSNMQTDLAKSFWRARKIDRVLKIRKIGRFVK